MLFSSEIDTQECQRIAQMSLIEEKLFSQGYKDVAGVDEAGRGPLAGPVAAAAVILPRHFVLKGVNDSKKLTALQRKRIFQAIIDSNISFATAFVDAEEIDQMNILQATFLAMKKAVHSLDRIPEFVLIDGNRSPQIAIPSKCIIRGDSLSISIATASVIAKVARDEIMEKYHEKYPQYGFGDHKGYGTKRHLEALYKYGPCPIHRFSFAPVKEALK